MTPHEAQFGTKPLRSWTKFINQDVITNEHKVSETEIHMRIKEKRQKAADKVNDNTTITKFEVGDQVLLRTSPVSDAINKIISKFCDLYEGPYVVKTKLGNSTHIIASSEILVMRGERGKFNIRLLKKYHQ